jgi:predicted Zn-dependent protease
MDLSLVSRWIESIAGRPGDVAEVFVEISRQVRLELENGEVIEARLTREEGTSARLLRQGTERLASVSGAGEDSAREAIRGLRPGPGGPVLPTRPARLPDPEAETLAAEAERWRRRLAAVFERHAPRHRVQWTLRDSERRVVPAGLPAAASTRRLLSLEGSFTAASRRGDELRRFSFHAPVSEQTADELRLALTRSAAPRERAVPFSDGESDVLFSGGCAAVLFHEILCHPLEGDARSPLSRLLQARVAVAELEVRDDPSRLDLFGGYESDDEGMRPRAVRLLDSGRLAGRLTDRRSAGAGRSSGHARRAGPSDPPRPRGSNVIAAAGHVTADELARRLGNGLWIDEIESGSIELVSGQFRLRVPRARRIRRGALADELGPGLLAGEILSALKGIEAGLGREVRPYRSLGWCAHGGQVVPVQGEAPDLLVRRLAVRSLS